MNKSYDFSKIKAALVGIGYPEEEATKQLNDLVETVTMKALARLGANAELSGIQTVEQLTSAIEGASQSDEAKKILAEESQNIADGYIEQVTQDLPEDQKRTFFQAISG